MIILSKEQIVLLHTQLIQEIGGTDGIREEGLLEAAVYAPFQGFGGEDIFQTVQEKAARLGYGLVKNHAFIDGNINIEDQNRLHPFYLVYIGMGGEVITNHLQPKDTLDMMRYMARGKTEPDKELCEKFNKEGRKH